MPQYRQFLIVPQHLIVRLPNQPERRPLRLPTERERKLIRDIKWTALLFVFFGSPPSLSDRLLMIAGLPQELEQRYGFVLSLDGWMVKLDPEILEYPLNAIEYAAAREDFATVCRIITRR
jgi:hypothetical protein